VISDGSQVITKGDWIVPPAHIDAVVRLKEDVSTFCLQCGAQGVVVSVWLSSGDFLCEVEFPKSARSPALRALLRADQLEVVE
jgi:hypothetical protein